MPNLISVDQICFAKRLVDAFSGLRCLRLPLGLNAGKIWFNGRWMIQLSPDAKCLRGSHTSLLEAA
jgi:hypothetical protein